MEYVTYPNGVEIWRVSPCPCAVIRLQWRQIGVLAPLEPFWRHWSLITAHGQGETRQISTPFGRKRNGADILRILKMVCASREPRKTFSKVGSRLNGLGHLSSFAMEKKNISLTSWGDMAGDSIGCEEIRHQMDLDVNVSLTTSLIIICHGKKKHITDFVIYH